MFSRRHPHARAVPAALLLAACAPLGSGGGFGGGSGAGPGGGKYDDPVPATQIDAIFSPQPYASSHLARVVNVIDAATRSLDIAMYSYGDAGINEALGRALARGVSVRMIYEQARAEQANPENTTSGRLEAMGIEVRYINKVMHHKFLLVDGYRTESDTPGQGMLATGSANWSRSAGTVYDENTLFIGQSPELNLRYQQEFNRLWGGSRPVTWNESIPHIDSAEVEDEMIPDDPRVDATFTSANFTVRESASSGPTWTVERASNAVADRWVELIQSAEQSIWIASGHLRSRPVVEALLAKHQEDPSLDIRIYLDQQEYLSTSSHNSQVEELNACLESAGDNESRRADCVDRGFLFSYQVSQAGIPLRFKFYAYRWDYHYAVQMHHKYMLIDGTRLLTGSYNLSDNAEHNTMENVLLIEGTAFPELVGSYVANFEQIWVTGLAEGRLGALTERVEDTSANSIPLVFDSMALDWQEVTDLKRLIRANCSVVDSPEFRTNPNAHRYCDR